MATQTVYNFTQQVDYPSVLISQIQASSISTVVVNVATAGIGGTMSVSISFKDALSDADVATLNNLMAAYNNPLPPLVNTSPPKVVQVLGSDTLTLCPFGAFSGTTIVAGTTTNWDVPLPQTMTLRGASLFSSNATLGDWISVSVIDINNVTGAGANAVLGQYVLSWYIVPGVWNTMEDISISQSLPSGMFLRFAYTSVGSTAPQAIVNFFSYVGTP